MGYQRRVHGMYLDQFHFLCSSHIMEILTYYSKKENFLGVIGDLNIRSEIGQDTSTELLDIFQQLGVKSLFKSVTHIKGGQLDYVLMKNDIPSNKYLAGTFKNLYSDHC